MTRLERDSTHSVNVYNLFFLSEGPGLVTGYRTTGHMVLNAWSYIIERLVTGYRTTDYMLLNDWCPGIERLVTGHRTTGHRA